MEINEVEDVIPLSIHIKIVIIQLTLVALYNLSYLSPKMSAKSSFSNFWNHPAGN